MPLLFTSKFSKLAHRRIRHAVRDRTGSVLPATLS
jgi:hypothetical protein